MKKRNNIMKKMLSLLTVTMLMVSGMNLQVFANDSKGGGGGYNKHEVELTKTFDGKKVKKQKIDNKTVTATFELWKKGYPDTKVGTYKIDKDGEIEVDLYNGKYYFKEVSVTDGYEMESKNIEFEVKGRDIDLKVDNKSKPKEYKVELTKTFDKKQPKDGKVDRKVVTATFELWKKGSPGSKIGTFTTDSNGKIETKLPKGHYYFKEISVTDGYEMAVNKEFEIKDGDIGFTINNEKSKPVEPVANMEFTKTANPVTYSKVGDVITYTFTVTNTGGKDLKDVKVNDIKLGITNKLLSPKDIAPGETATGTATYTIKEADIDLGKVDNTAIAKAKYKDGRHDKDLDRTATATVKYEPEVQVKRGIELIKTANPTTYTHVGQKVTYTFEVKNTGEVALTGFYLYDAMLGIAENSAITIEPGQTKTLHSHDYTITAADMEKDSIVNTAYTNHRYGTGENEYVFDYADATITKKITPPEPTDPIGEIIVTKRDSRTNAVLPGAVFRLYAPELVGEGGYGPNMSSFLTGTTGPSGQLIFKVDELGYNSELFYGRDFVSFFLQEITAPSGYTGSNAIQEVKMAKICLDEPVPVMAAEPVILDPIETVPVQEVEVVSSEVLSEEVIVTEEPVAEEPVAEEPVAEEPVAEEPVAEEPVAEEPVAEEPVAEEPVAEEPVVEEPVVEQPVVEQPPVEQPKAPQSLAVTTENGEHDCYEYLLKSVERTIYNTPIDTPTPPGGGGGGGATPQSPVRPDPDRPITVPDEPTPLAPPEVAVGEVIVPLAEPEVQDIIADEVIADEVIADDVVALAAVPQTGIGYTDYSNVISTNYIITVDAILTDKKRK